MSSPIVRRCRVSGRVQGVFFRASARQKALQLGCRGYARNLADGRVEVLVVGDSSSVQSLVDWLWIGPPAAHVTRVDVEEIAPDQVGDLPAGFSTG